MTMRNADLGHAWAQTMVGQELCYELLTTQDSEKEQKAMELLQAAADQGDLDAQVHLCGARASNNEQDLELFLPLAQKGHGRSQYVCGILQHNEQLDLNAEAWIWLTLAAAQGVPEACFALGNYWCLASDACDEDAFAAYRAYYWFKMAAVKGSRPAQLKTALILPVIRKALFDGAPNLVGYSCAPEVISWNRQGPSSKETDDAKAACGADLEHCGCCGVSGSRGRRAVNHADNVKIKPCAKCRSIGYCSRECQKKHWKMGHKVDCQKFKAKTTRLPADAAPAPASTNGDHMT